MPLRVVVLFSFLLASSLCWAKPPSREEFERQTQVVAQLKDSLALESTDAARFTLISQAMGREQDPDVRHKIIDLAAGFRGPALEAFLTSLVTKDDDAGLRSQAATLLGRTGSEKCLPILTKVAASDRTSGAQRGDIRMSSSARRSAIFAVAELVGRYPNLADKAKVELAALPDKFDLKDNESLADARRQALFQINHDESLLLPFFERLKSADAAERERGVVAFRFLKLKKAPPEIVRALKDENAGVRSWAALVLGEIGDAGTIDTLMATAADSKLDRNLRANAIASLGQMKAMPAADLMEKLLADPDVSLNAAIALYRITGQKVKQFPEGYNAD